MRSGQVSDKPEGRDRLDTEFRRLLSRGTSKAECVLGPVLEDGDAGKQF